ncbi:EamA family transporter [Aeromonas diversa]|uniref:Drug/metabolite exporter (DME) family transporter n=1 Tax=Aeromonas diversa CDC 2478-85 TaxID=1268237 RepID=N9U0U7_9GAMM|nr:EamA family transporter [Aeromonas diversa]ENY71935.1 drug/metabolite exporter (DME) family transporter [Aeromonas diversa CDC 2478-85]
MTNKDKLLAALIVICWGLNFVAIRWGLDGVPPLLLGALRFLAVVFPAILFIPRPALPWRWLVAYGATLSLGQFAFLFCAINAGMPAGIASLVLQSQVIFTLLFAMVALGERWLPHHWVALPVAAGGLALIAGGGAGNLTLIGFFLTLCAAASWGLGNVINRHIGLRYPVHLPGLVAWSGLVPILPFLSLSWWLEGQDRIIASLSHFSLTSVLCVLYLAYVATWFGYGLWARLLTRYPVAQVAPLTLLVPCVGMLAAALLLGEHTTAQQWLGSVLVLLGFLIHLLGPRLWAWRARPALSQT